MRCATSHLRGVSNPKSPIASDGSPGILKPSFGGRFVGRSVMSTRNSGLHDSSSARNIEGRKQHDLRVSHHPRRQIPICDEKLDRSALGGAQRPYSTEISHTNRLVDLSPCPDPTARDK